MKKVVLLTFLFASLSFSSFADIIIRGKIVMTQHGNGDTYIYCKGLDGQCIRIVTTVGGKEEVYLNGDTGPIAIENYSIKEDLIDGEIETVVTLKIK